MSPDFRITLALTVQEADAILSALAELPFKQSADLIGKIRTNAFAQIEQDKAKAEAVPAVPVEPAP
jgi:hypothetical protein